MCSIAAYPDQTTSLVRQYLPGILKSCLHTKGLAIILLPGMAFYIPFEQFVESSNRSGNFPFRIEVIS